MLDLDNTLGNRTDAVQLWIQEFVEAWSLPADAADWILQQDNDGYRARAEVFTAIHQRYGLTDTVERILEDYQARVVALAEPTVGAVQCLERLRADGHAIAIVSNGSTKQQHAKIDVMGLRPLVDAVIVSGDLRIKKPDPHIFEAAASATGESLNGSWMVGDSAVNDVVGGHQVGAKTAWLHRGRTWSNPTWDPTVVLDDLSQFCDALAHHG